MYSKTPQQYYIVVTTSGMRVEGWGWKKCCHFQRRSSLSVCLPVSLLLEIGILQPGPNLSPRPTATDRPTDQTTKTPPPPAPRRRRLRQQMRFIVWMGWEGMCARSRVRIPSGLGVGGLTRRARAKGSRRDDLRNNCCYAFPPRLLKRTWRGAAAKLDQ